MFSSEQKEIKHGKRGIGGPTIGALGLLAFLSDEFFDVYPVNYPIDHIKNRNTLSMTEAVSALLKDAGTARVDYGELHRSIGGGIPDRQ
ncbi:MAG: hypothetical protein NTX75_07595 [Proteobacteria bacterium]|nr:hypothetical protein [Pseudomonadota bacterium]